MDHTVDMQTIGFIIKEISGSHISPFLDLLNQKLLQHNCRLITAVSNNQLEVEQQQIQYMTSTADALLIDSCAPSYKDLKDYLPEDFPTLFLSHKPEGCEKSTLCINNYSAVYQLLLNLSQCSSFRIGLLCENSKRSDTKEILKAYYAVMDTIHDHSFEKWIRYVDSNESKISEHIESLIQEGCEAIFCASSRLTDQCLDYVILYSSFSGKNITVTGFSPAKHRNTLQKSIDSVGFPVSQMVELTVLQILFLLDHPDSPAKDYLLKSNVKFHSLDPLHINQ